MARVTLCFALLAVSAHAAVIRGSVVENATGNLLARSLVTLQPLSSSAGKIISLRTGQRGVFEFDNLPAGGYLVRASRPGFLPREYGQKRWNSAGTPVVLDPDGTAFLNIRLSRYGAITGAVRDENEVGVPDQDVVAYSDTQPPQLEARGKSDDRGLYRIPGLAPGRYLVRTTGNVDGDLRYIPTFSAQTLRVEEARSVDVFLDEEVRYADVRPIQGVLFNLSGSAPIGSNRPLTVSITLASDMGRRTTEGPAFNFPSLAPGPYELYAVAKDDATGSIVLGGYTQFNLDRNMPGFTLAMNEIRPTRFSLEGSREGVTVMTRHKDLAGVGAAETLDSTRPNLSPGRWEFMVMPPAGSWVSRFFPAPRDKTVRPDGWNEVLIDSRNFASVSVTISGGGGALHGTIKGSNESPAGAPVFLEAWDPVTRKRLTDLRITHADMRGQYRFDGLPPGSYRVLSTFEYLMPDAQAIDVAGARDIGIEAHADLQVDLDLYDIR